MSESRTHAASFDRDVKPDDATLASQTSQIDLADDVAVDETSRPRKRRRINVDERSDDEAQLVENLQGDICSALGSEGNLDLSGISKSAV